MRAVSFDDSMQSKKRKKWHKRLRSNWCVKGGEEYVLALAKSLGSCGA